MGSTPVSRAALVSRLKAASDYFASYPDRHGDFACQRHFRVTHWGKIAYALVIDGFLYDELGEPIFLERGLRLVPQIVDQVRKVDDHWVFYPGRLNRANASNNAIDSGAIVDCLASWYGRFGDHLQAPMRERLRAACLNVASSYLPNTLGKPTNQILWAMTGLAAAFRYLDPRQELRAACSEALELALADQWSDGAFPYLPERLRGADHSSLHEISGYYHSRHAAFWLDVARKIEHSPDARQLAALRRSADFSCALQDPRGRKDLRWEAKHWYWPAPGEHERASAPFDFCALSDAVELFGDQVYRRAQVLAAESMVEGALPDGSVDAVATGAGMGTPFQCPQFWTAHLAWAARALSRNAPAQATDPISPPYPGIFQGRESGVVVHTTRDWQVRLRTRRTPLTPLFGGYCVGFSGLFHRSDGFERDLLGGRRFDDLAPGQLFLSSPSQTLAQLSRRLEHIGENRRDFRFAASLIRDALKLGDWQQARRLTQRFLGRQERYLSGTWRRELLSSFWALKCRFEPPSAERSSFRLHSTFACADGSMGRNLTRPIALRQDLELELDSTSARIHWKIDPIPIGWRLCFIGRADADPPTLIGLAARKSSTKARWELEPASSEEPISISWSVLRPEPTSNHRPKNPDDP